MFNAASVVIEAFGEDLVVRYVNTFGEAVAPEVTDGRMLKVSS